MSTTIQNIRALLWQFQRAQLKDFYWRRGDISLFLAGMDGAANPMLAQSVAPAAAVKSATGVAIAAPHLGLFEPCCVVGDSVEPGTVIARIDVLGRKTNVVAKVAGRVVSIGFAANDLVEFGDCLLEVDVA